jgi:hypothetical protein
MCQELDQKTLKKNQEKSRINLKDKELQMGA